MHKCIINKHEIGYVLKLIQTIETLTDELGVYELDGHTTDLRECSIKELEEIIKELLKLKH